MKKMRWGWILLGGVLGEITTIVLITVMRLLSGQSMRDVNAQFSVTSQIIFMVGVFTSLFVFAWWVARKALTRPILHGVLVGVAAVLTYELMTIRLHVPVNWQYVVIDGLKLVGGAVGGWLAATRRHAQDTVVMA